jgi:hypothetical protein
VSSECFIASASVRGEAQNARAWEVGTYDATERAT